MRYEKKMSSEVLLSSVIPFAGSGLGYAMGFAKARQMFTSEILKDCKYLPNEGFYWICQHRKGWLYLS
jgi:hypothetical protein